MLEALPLSKALTVKTFVTRVRSVDEAEICSHEVESGSIGRGLILEKIARRRRVVDVCYSRCSPYVKEAGRNICP